MSKTIRIVVAGLSMFVVMTALVAAPTADAATRRRGNSALQKKINALGDDPELTLRVPILFGVKPGDFGDTWGEARSNGRTHEGTDILAPRNAFIVSPTKAVVSEIGVGANGGNFVYTTNAGGERYYFAHLDHYAEELDEGDELDPGDLIGYVGNTGNASGGPTHLHFGIYTNHGAVNPFERLTKTFSASERMDALEPILNNADDEDALARELIVQYPANFTEAQVQGVDIPDAIKKALAARSVAVPIPPTTSAAANAPDGDLTIGSRGAGVIALQTFLIKANKGSAAKALAAAGATGYFGPITRSALAEYQAAVGITPAAGYFGPITRARIQATTAVDAQ